MLIKTFFTSIFIFVSLIAFSQNDEDLIRHTIQNYFNGTAYNRVEQIKAAFHPEAELYLEKKDGSLWKLSSDEYIAMFEDNEPGKFGGRFSKILSIEIEGNLALVKAEILVPSINKRFIDVFIMKEFSEGKWLIASKAANWSYIKKKE